MNIILGGVQFGHVYGVSNTIGKTTANQVEKILTHAFHNDIKAIDTSPAYGDSEIVIGHSIRNYDFDVITKSPVFTDNVITNTHVSQLRNSLNQSLDNLRKESLYGLLCHSCDNLLKPGGDLIFDEMQKLKSIGLIKKIGVSVYNSKQIENKQTKTLNINIITK